MRADLLVCCLTVLPGPWEGAVTAAPYPASMYIVLQLCFMLNHEMAYALSSCQCRFDPATSDINDLKRLLTFSSKFVNSLHLQQLPSHIDLQIIFDAMRRYDSKAVASNLQFLSLSTCLVVYNKALSSTC